MHQTERQEKLDRQTAELYQAVGEFTVNFEHVTYTMQQGVISLMQLSGLKSYQVGEILLAELTAHPLKSMLQALLAELLVLSTDDRKICDNLFARTQKLIEQRNNIIHSTWFVGWAHADDTEFSDALGQKLSRGKTGAKAKTFTYKAEEFRLHSAECKKVSTLLFRLNACALRGRSISKNFVTSKTGVVSESTQPES